MAKMPDSDLRAMIAAQHQDALSAVSGSKLTGDRATSMEYYNGVINDMPAAAGRSSAVSMDVSDTVEGILPQLMEVFCGTDEVVKFEPVGPEDVQAAEQETDYINHVFMNQNPGFLILYSFIKDALLSKNGFVKVWWEKETKTTKETYYDKTEDEYALIVANPDVEVIEHTEHEDDASGISGATEPTVAPGSAAVPAIPQPTGPAANPPGLVAGGGAGGQSLQSISMVPQKLHDVTVEIKKEHAQARVMGVPPEEFGIERGARNIQDCNYCYHKVVDRTEADLIAAGYDENQIKALPTYRAISNTEEQTRDTVDENSQAGSDSLNTSARTVEITEHYVRMDYEGNGKPCLYRVTTGGQQAEILKLHGKPDIIDFDAIPFAAMTPIIVTHRFYGKSIADIVMDIQRVKTALLRGGLDGMYIGLNPRVVVSEQGASENTLDDLLVSRPNQIVRVKGDAQSTIAYQQSPDVTPAMFNMLEYQDQRLESRTGYSKRGQGIDADALSNQSATAAKIVENSSQARVRLIARIFAETGIRDLFWLLHATIKKHGQQAAVVRLKNQWVNVDPREWKSREDLTVHVGLGTSGRQQQILEITTIGSLQKDLLLNGKTNLVTDENLYSTLKDLVKATGRPNVDAYFSDPSKKGPDGRLINPPPPPKPDPKIMELQVKAQLEERGLQLKAEIEKIQAQADIATQDRKTQAEIALADRKFQLERELAIIEHQAKMAESQETLAMKREQHQQTMQREDSKFAMESHHKTMDANAKLAETGMAQGKDGAVVPHPAIADALKAVAETNARLEKALTAPRRTRATKDRKTGTWESVSSVEAH